MIRKSLDTSIADLTQAIGLLVRRIRTAAASEDFSLTEASVMARLERGGPITIADLARAEGVKPQSMGATIAALEEMACVERKPHPRDGRQVLIQLTAQGAAIRKKLREAKETWLAQAVAKLDKEEQSKLFAAAEIIKRLAEF